MAGPFPKPNPNLDPHLEPTTGTPRWVKVVGIVALLVIVVFVALLLTGGPGRHGPGRHIGGLGGHPQAAAIPAQRAQPR